MSTNTLFKSPQKNRKGNSPPRKFNYYLLPLIIVLLIVPLIVHEYTYENSYQQYSWFTSQTDYTDFFLYYKNLLITIVGFVIILLLCYQRFIGNKVPKAASWIIPLAVYAAFVIISAIASEHQDVVWTGSLEQFEPTLAILTYCILLYYSYVNVRDEDDIKTLIKFTAIGMAIMLGICFFQLAGHDIFRSKLGKMLIVDRKNWDYLDSYTFQFEENRVYGTLYNPNYIGVYSSLLFPIAAGLTFLSTSKKKKIVAGILSVLLVLATFGAQSKTGLIVLIITGILLLFIFRKYIFKHMKVLIASFVVLIGAFFIINVTQNFTYFNMIKNAFVGSEEEKSLQKIETTDERIIINYNNKELYIRCEQDDSGSFYFEILDENQYPYENTFDSTEMKYILADPVFNNMSLSPIYLDEDKTIFGCEIVIDNKSWYFKSKDSTSGYQYLNGYGNLDTIITPSSALFDKHGSIFTGRGYLWSRTIPLLKDTILIGTGADTFGYYFPQSDYVGRGNYGFDNTIITKPHSMYLQIGIQTGVISLIAFLILYLWYFIDSIKTYHKCEYKTFTERIGVLLFIGTIGYMISGIINDSTITVAPMFWVILGVGLACNRITKEYRNRIKKIHSL